MSLEPYKASRQLSATTLTLNGSLAEVHVRSVTRNVLGPLHSSFWSKIENRQQFRNWVKQPLDWSPQLVFVGKGLKASYPCNIKFDRILPKGTRMFALKVAEAELRFPWAHRLAVDCGLLLAPASTLFPDDAKAHNRGLFVRVGYFEIAVSKMHRDWADHRALWRWKNLNKVRGGLWKNSRIEKSFWQEWDGKDRYIITVV